ncbi:MULTISPECIES: dihydrofolate reductase family protein [Furfurilactobacillus]|uniref:Dihydrofolate reductase n=1 Tax=Furfurilactobacillus rossiae TaxID=231049 RepID=A0A7C9J2P0_9LACO|nr:dihydrofolate reductase family protein [Furfurilactobacillus milii]MYV05978.1 dihydrofolate reductase [Furfurilactobacillus milii]
MRSVILYIATSLDGRLADANGELDWLTNTAVDGDAGYDRLMGEIDTLIMGRTTYDYVINHTDVYPYEGLTSIVLTHHEISATDGVQTYHGDVVTLVRQLRQKSGKAIWIVGGGKIVGDLIQAELIDELRLFVAPTFIGAGPQLWQSGAQQKAFELMDVSRAGQLAELDYSVKRN